MTLFRAARAPRRRALIAAALPLALVAAACGDDGGSDADSSDAGLTPVRLQLQWFAQSQFAGYYAALEEGFYEDEGLDVSILEGGVDIVPQQVLDSGQAEFAVAWVPKALASREEGVDIVEVAQIFQRSGTLQVSWADDDLTDPTDLEGTMVGNWGFGNELELFAGLRGAGFDPDRDVELIQQNFDMQALINREIDSAQAMIYNEYGQLLQTEDPDTGELFQPEQFNMIDWNDVGAAMLQDALWARTDWLDDPDNQEVATGFVKATLRGWAFCRDAPDTCVQHVLAHGTQLPELHMTYMMNEINPLVWPAADGVGMVDAQAWSQTVDISLDSGFITEDPGEDAYNMDIVAAALAELEAEGIDVTGESFEPVATDLNGE